MRRCARSGAAKLAWRAWDRLWVVCRWASFVGFWAALGGAGPLLCAGALLLLLPGRAGLRPLLGARGPLGVLCPCPVLVRCAYQPLDPILPPLISPGIGPVWLGGSLGSAAKCSNYLMR